MEKDEIKVTEAEFSEASTKINEDLKEALQHAKMNLITFHQAQKRNEWTIEVEKGVFAGQIYRPIESVGIYVPGGRTIYPSTVLMAVIPAYVVGVKEIIICTPPQNDKKVSSEILFAAQLFEINTIFKIGGAQAIAAMAYGTETIPKVQKIIGPGNKWVNTAKKLISSDVAIDTLAGPSEILIIADENTDYKLLIYDLFSQMEHDPDNIGVVVSDSTELIEKVKLNLEPMLEHARKKDIIESALNNNLLLIKTKNVEDSAYISNIIAPEHLEILTNNPSEVLKNIQNAGAIFLGKFSPVSVGDYCAGTNHILPTGGKAKIYSGLNIYDFLKVIDVLNCDKQGLKHLSKTAMTLAEFERFSAHKKSVEERLINKD